MEALLTYKVAFTCVVAQQQMLHDVIHKVLQMYLKMWHLLLPLASLIIDALMM